MLRLGQPRSGTLGVEERTGPRSIPPVSQPLKPRRPGPPNNPGLGKLVAGKCQWTAPPKPADLQRGFRGWHERGYLPHRDEPGLTQLVTFNLADAFPLALRSKWEALLQVEDDRERQRQLEEYLDCGHGDCLLRRADVAQLVENALRYRHGPDYELRAWVIMANHVHVLFKVGAVPMSRTLEDWKKFTAHEANKLLNRRGQFWQEDYWDTYMRDAAQELRARRYIENNPVKALLVRDPKDWAWSSARFRDEQGELHL